jgi:nucleotide-binding universal stress UspA family protein
MFKTVLVALDRSPSAEEAIGQAAAIARASKAKLDLVLVPQRGEAVDMICKRAWDVDADLIVMTSHCRTGLSRAWSGSVADGVVRHSSTPVLMLRPVESEGRRRAAHHLFKRVLVPLDGSVFARGIIMSAVSLARCSDARVTLLRVIRPIPLVPDETAFLFSYPPPVHDDAATNRLATEATEQLSAIARDLCDHGAGSIDARVIVASDVAQTILEFARIHAIDVIAMSTHGSGASRFLMGSVADKILRDSGLPTLLRRPLGLYANTEPIESPAARQIPALAPA